MTPSPRLPQRGGRSPRANRGPGPWLICVHPLRRGDGPRGDPPGPSAILALGALLGDLAGAFVKRRMGKPRGAKAPGLDQYDFVAVGLLLSLLVPAWSVPRFF